MITENGVYDIPIEDYHQKVDLCDGPSISSSGLCLLDTKSPAHLFAQSPLNPDAVLVRSREMNFGQAAHAMTFGEAHFNSMFAIEPFEAGYNRNEAWGSCTKKRQWKSTQEKSGHTIIKQEEIATIEAMARALNEHPLVKLGLFAGDVEKSIIWKDKETGVWLRSRPDVIPLDDMISDYKTIESAMEHHVRQATADREYYRQLALAVEGLREACGQKIRHYALLFQEKKPPYAIQVVELDADYVAWGMCQNRRAIRTFAKCVETGEWPGFDTKPIVLSAPMWLSNRLEKQQEAKELPSFLEAGVTIDE